MSEFKMISNIKSAVDKFMTGCPCVMTALKLVTV